MRAPGPLLGRGDPTAFVALAEELRIAGQHGDALKVLREGFKRSPDLPSGRRVLAQVHLDLGEPKRAAEVLIELLELEPDDLAALVMAARLALGRGEAAEAGRLHARAQEVAPDDLRVRALGESIQPRAAPLRLPEDPFTSSWLAERLAAAGRPAAAQRIWQALRHLDPERVDHELAGHAHDLEGRDAAAAAQLPPHHVRPGDP